MNLTVTPEIYEWMANQLHCDIQNLYDDPYGMCDYPFSDEDPADFEEPAVQIRKQVDLLRDIAKVLDVNFDDIVKKNTTGYEQIRINNILLNTGSGQCPSCEKEAFLVDGTECASCTNEPPHLWNRKPEKDESTKH